MESLQLSNSAINKAKRHFNLLQNLYKSPNYSKLDQNVKLSNSLYKLSLEQLKTSDSEIKLTLFDLFKLRHERRNLQIKEHSRPELLTKSMIKSDNPISDLQKPEGVDYIDIFPFWQSLTASTQRIFIYLLENKKPKLAQLARKLNKAPSSMTVSASLLYEKIFLAHGIKVTTKNIRQDFFSIIKPSDLQKILENKDLITIRNRDGKFNRENQFIPETEIDTRKAPIFNDFWNNLTDKQKLILINVIEQENPTVQSLANILGISKEFMSCKLTDICKKVSIYYGISVTLKNIKKDFIQKVPLGDINRILQNKDLFLKNLSNDPVSTNSDQSAS